MNFFVKSDAQDIFTILIAAGVMATLVAGLSSSDTVSGIAFSIVFAVISLWFGAIANAANVRLPDDLRLNAQTVKNVTIVSNVAAVVLFVGIIPNISNDFDSTSDFPIMLPLPIGILSLGGLVYLSALAAKQLVTYEKGRAVSFAEYQPTFLSLWFWYVGIWSLQPRVQRLAR